MKLSFEYGTNVIKFDLIYKKRKTLEIRIEPPNVVTVIAPMGLSEQKVLEQVKTKSRWIVRKLSEVKDIKYKPIKKEFVNGEVFMYLGLNYRLQIVIEPTVSKPIVSLTDDKFVISTSTTDEAILYKVMEQWYRSKAQEKIGERVAYYSHKLNKTPKNIKIKEQKKRWGSCSSLGNLNFNWKCIMAPASVLDYLVVHEMCHLFHMNHSKDFWNMVASILPDYKQRKEWLKKHGVRMSL
ncbi:MAG: M48 family metallopeptidase [Clostridia bacterium]